MPNNKTAGSQAKEIEIPEKGIVLIVSRSNHYNDVNKEIIKKLVGFRKKRCVYLSMNRPSVTLLKEFEEAGIDTSKIFIIDCVTKLAGEDVERAGNAVFVESPQSLTEMGSVLDGAVKSLPVNGSFLFLDSITTMLLYNAAKSVATFIHFLTLKIRFYKMAGVMISLELEETKQIISQINQFCDYKIII